MDTSTDSKYGHWQGVHWRRTCRLFPFAFLLLVAFSGWSNGSPSISQAFVILGCVGFVFLVSEFGFARKMGFETRKDCLILIGPIRRVKIDWGNVQGFTWRGNFSFSKGKQLCVVANQKTPRRVPPDAPVRVPTVGYVSDTRRLNDRLLGPLLSSPQVRAGNGREADVMELLEQALSQAVTDGIAQVKTN